MIHVGDNTWNIRIMITDLQVEKTLRVKGDLHIGGVMLKLSKTEGELLSASEFPNIILQSRPKKKNLFHDPNSVQDEEEKSRETLKFIIFLKITLKVTCVLVAVRSLSLSVFHHRARKKKRETKK